MILCAGREFVKYESAGCNGEAGGLRAAAGSALSGLCAGFGAYVFRLRRIGFGGAGRFTLGRLGGFHDLAVAFFLFPFTFLHRGTFCRHRVSNCQVIIPHVRDVGAREIGIAAAWHR